MVQYIIHRSRKTFGDIDHCILHKMVENMGARGIVLEWQQSYFDQRQQYVDFNNEKSVYLKLSVVFPRDQYHVLCCLYYILMLFVIIIIIIVVIFKCYFSGELIALPLKIFKKKKKRKKKRSIIQTNRIS